MADIFGVRVTPELNVLDTLIICNKVSGQTEPAVIFNGENHIVVWLDLGIMAARVTPQGTVLDTGYYIGNGGNHPDIAFDNNRCLVIWSKDADGIYGRFINNYAQPEDTVFRIDTAMAGGTIPKLDFDGINYLIVWADFNSAGTDLDIYGQFVSTQGQLMGSKITIANGSQSQNNPNIIFDGANYLVVWAEASTDIFGQRVQPDGHLLDDKFRISDNTAENRDQPAVSVGVDNYLIVWSEYHDDFDIYGNVDVMIGINEEKAPQVKQFIPSIISGSVFLPDLQNFKVYDVIGRSVNPQRLESGVYFIRIDDQVIKKLVRIR